MCIPSIFQPQADASSQGDRTPPKNPSSKEPTPQPEDRPRPAEGDKPDPEDRQSPPPSAEDVAAQSPVVVEDSEEQRTEDTKEASTVPELPAEGPSPEEQSASSEDKPANPEERPASPEDKPATSEDKTAPLEDRSASPERRSSPEPEATPPPPEDTTSAQPSPSPKELSPVPEETSTSSTASAADETTPVPAGSETQEEEPASASRDPAPKAVTPDVEGKGSEEPQPEEVDPAPVVTKETTSPDTEKAPEKTSDQVDGKEHLPVSELPLKSAAETKTPPPTPVEEQTPSPVQEERVEEEIQTSPALANGHKTSPSSEELVNSSAEEIRPENHTSVKEMATSPPAVMDSPAVALTAADGVDQSAVELPPQPANQQTGITMHTYQTKSKYCLLGSTTACHFKS